VVSTKPRRVRSAAGLGGCWCVADAVVVCLRREEGLASGAAAASPVRTKQVKRQGSQEGEREPAQSQPVWYGSPSALARQLAMTSGRTMERGCRASHPSNHPTNHPSNPIQGGESGAVAAKRPRVDEPHTVRDTAADAAATGPCRLCGRGCDEGAGTGPLVNVRVHQVRREDAGMDQAGAGQV
jgi:hypothetical protein